MFGTILQTKKDQMHTVFDFILYEMKTLLEPLQEHPTAAYRFIAKKLIGNFK